MQTWQIIALCFIGLCTFLTLFWDKLFTKVAASVTPKAEKVVLDGEDLCGLFNYLVATVKNIPSAAVLDVREAIAKQVMPFESKD